MKASGTVRPSVSRLADTVRCLGSCRVSVFRGIDLQSRRRGSLRHTALSRHHCRKRHCFLLPATVRCSGFSVRLRPVCKCHLETAAPAGAVHTLASLGLLAAAAATAAADIAAAGSNHMPRCRPRRKLCGCAFVADHLLPGGRLRRGVQPGNGVPLARKPAQK